MPKKKTSDSRALVPVGQTKTYPIANTQLQATQIFRVPQRHPRGRGPWQHEVEKIAWRDPATCMACTILRQQDGALGGFVGVTEDHPLYGYNTDAVPGSLGISPHGGLSYAAQCDNGPEEISICHPSEQPPARARARTRKGPSNRSEGQGGDHRPLWWFGFTCDLNHDLVPGRRESAHDLGAENGRTYRDEAYVYGQTCKLARQLTSLGKSDGDTGVPLDLSNASPPVGLHPEKRR